MKPLTRYMVQDAVYWAQISKDGYGGRSYAAGIDIKVRWEDSQDMVIDPNGETFTSRAQVITDLDMGFGDYLYLGTLSDLTPEQQADPSEVDLAYQVRTYNNIPSVKGDQILKQVIL